MDQPSALPLRIGAWCVNPASGQISRDTEVVRVEARTMRLLLCLAERAGEVVSIEDLLTQVWSGVIVTPDSVYQAVASLRRLLGDDPKQPTYIATVPRLGYRMVAKVSPWTAQPPAERPTPGPRRGVHVSLAISAGLCFALAVAFLYRHRAVNDVHAAAAAGVPQKSVAVLPFLDLTTEAMNEEYFADGMTEELIDKLSKIPGLRVPPPTSSFYFKGKRIPVADIAKSLAVAYVLDGSVRKSDATLRVAVRLVRAADGYVVWTETYDRPLGDKLEVQDDIAGEITKALQTSIMQASPVAAGAPEAGARIYDGNCVACHQQNGRGIPGVYPSLAGSPVVLGDPKTFALWVIKGQRDVSMPAGKYATAMPQFGWMKAADAAALLTYLRSNFGNAAPPVPAANLSAAFGD
jgi:transcriptional activator of cad operon